MVDKNITGNRKSQFSCIFISSLPAKEIKGGDKKNNNFFSIDVKQRNRFQHHTEEPQGTKRVF